MPNSGPRIYVERGDDLDAYEDTLFESEDKLQELLARHVQLVSGDEEGRHWLLVTREAGVPDAGGAGDRWALDHLFVDQAAVPALVEVKRASDTRIRREVVGQLLDYAANGAKHWTADKLQQFAKDELGDQYEAKILRHLGGTDNEPADNRIESFWSAVEDNLRAGRMRLIFAADRLPAELVTVIEFLNRAMPNIEVVGLQVQQYAYEGRRLLVTRTKGKLEGVSRRRGTAARTNPNVREVLQTVKRRVLDELGDRGAAFDDITKVPNKQLAFGKSYPGVGWASFFVHAGLDNPDTWSPIDVGLSLGCNDNAVCNIWKEKLDAARATHESATLTSGGSTLWLIMRSFPWESVEELTPSFIDAVVDALTATIDELQPQLGTKH